MTVSPARSQVKIMPRRAPGTASGYLTPKAQIVETEAPALHLEGAAAPTSKDPAAMKKIAEPARTIESMHNHFQCIHL